MRRRARFGARPGAINPATDAAGGRPASGPQLPICVSSSRSFGAIVKPVAP